MGNNVKTYFQGRTCPLCKSTFEDTEKLDGEIHCPHCLWEGEINQTFSLGYEDQPIGG